MNKSKFTEGSTSLTGDNGNYLTELTINQFNGVIPTPLALTFEKFLTSKYRESIGIKLLVSEPSKG